MRDRPIYQESHAPMTEDNQAHDAIEQHRREIEETMVQWRRKPMLRAAYHEFHGAIRNQLQTGDGLTVELGSGVGMIKDTIPHCVTTDLFPNPHVDQVEDAYRLTFADGSVDNLILFDVWHHLQYPATAMKEFARVLTPEGRIILFEPAALSLLGRFVYGVLHHEPILANHNISWELPPELDPADLPYYAAQGNAWRMFVGNLWPPELQQHWQLKLLQRFTALDWLAAGGFRKNQLCPTSLKPVVQKVSRALDLLPPVLFATRMLVVLERRG